MESFFQNLINKIGLKYPKTRLTEYAVKLEFSSHFFFHATLTFLFGLIFSSWYLQLIPFGMAFIKELVVDKHYKDLFEGTVGSTDGVVDLIARSLGALIAFILMRIL